MKHLTILLFALPLALTGQGQEIDIKSIPLPYNIVGENNITQSKMILEDETVYVATSNGIYPCRIVFR